MRLNELLESLKEEVNNFCSTINEATGADVAIHVITPDEQEEDRLDLEEIILDTEVKVNKRERNLVDAINKAIEGKATLDDIVKASMSVKKDIDKYEREQFNND